MQKILIVGGTGSLGVKLSEFFLSLRFEVAILSRNENKQWSMKKKFPSVSFFIGDVCDIKSINNCIFEFQPTWIVIAAALKHVDICEKFIGSSININVTGILNVLESVYIHDKQGTIPFLKTVLFVSTDKAVEPITVYGMCKSIVERKMTEMSERMSTSSIKFITTRYGNVLFSSGSILPVFNEIAQNGKTTEFTVTHTDMTRFIMTLDESVQLIYYALLMGKTGEIWCPKLKGFRIIDLANGFSKKYKKSIKTIGLRGIEKIHEKLIATHEIPRTTECGIYYVICPKNQINSKVLFTRDYTSNNCELVNPEYLI